MLSKLSPTSRVKGAEVLMFEAVWLVKRRSYAMETSPLEVNVVGRLLVSAVSETEKSDEPLSLTLKRLPTLPFGPILMAKRSPVALTVEPGLQSKDKSPPEVKAVEVEIKDKRLPELRELAVILAAFPVVAADVWV